MPAYTIQSAIQDAFTPFGSSPGAAVAVAVAYGAFLGPAFGNLLVTKYPFYDALLASIACRSIQKSEAGDAAAAIHALALELSPCKELTERDLSPADCCAVRMVAFSCRAVYLTPGRFSPALVGCFLTFSNSGLGAQTATILLAIGSWLSVVGNRFYSLQKVWLIRLSAYFLILCLIIAGLLVGPIAAGLSYGAYDRGAALYGHRMRSAACYTLAAVEASTVILSLFLTTSCYITQRRQSHYSAASCTQSQQHPKLCVLLLLAGCLLSIRAACGVAALYPQTSWLWDDDVPFYLLNTLPEMAALVIVTWPTLLSRMAQQYPRALGLNAAEKRLEDDHHGKLSQAVKTGMHAFAGIGMGKHNSKEDRGLP